MVESGLFTFCVRKSAKKLTYDFDVLSRHSILLIDLSIGIANHGVSPDAGEGLEHILWTSIIPEILLLHALSSCIEFILASFCLALFFLEIVYVLCIYRGYCALYRKGV